MKQIITLWLTMLLSFVSTKSFAQDFEVDGIYYTYLSQEDNTVSVSYKGNSYSDYSNEYYGNVVIPTSVAYNGTTFSVTSIGDYAFFDCTSLASIEIPNSVTSIGDSAFYGCKGLTSIVIPSSVTSIGNDAFHNCTGLTSIEIPNSVTSIGNYAFSGCTGLTSIEIPNSITGIGSGTFSGCTGLTSIVLPNSVTSMGNSAFHGCSGLTSIVIPNSVTSIDNRTFLGCKGLTSIMIPNSVTSIGDSTFYGCKGLTSIVIPNSVTSIGNHAFYGCNGLTSIVIPNSVTKISDRTFYGCTSLTSIEFPNSLKSIGNRAFYGCTSLTSIEIPNSVKSIGDGAFSNCTGKATIHCDLGPWLIGSKFDVIEIGEEVTTIGNSAFANYIYLTNIIVPNSITSVGRSAFKGCTNLQYNERDNALYIGNDNNPCVVLIKTKDKEIETCYIDKNCKVIYERAFSNCKNLTKIEIPNSVMNIGHYAFSDCPKLHFNEKGNALYLGNTDNPYVSLIKTKSFNISSCDIDKNCKFVHDGAFKDCEKLMRIIIPSKMISIGDSVFSGCKLRDIQVLNETPSSITETSFNVQSQYHSTLFVPYDCFNNYAYHPYWYKFIHIKESASSIQNLSPQQAYALKSATTRSYIIYDAVNDAVKDIALDANIDEDNANHNWQVIKQDGQTYIYNIGAKKYLYANTPAAAAPMHTTTSSFAANASTQWKLSSIPVAVSLSSGESGINIGNSGEWLFVLNPTLAVDENVSAIEQFETNDKAISIKAYTLQGTQTSEPAKNALYIRNGKKIIIK